jgi:delta14-sterol reductase
LWTTVDLPNPEHPLWLTVIFGIIFYAGWMTSRGANMQKFYFKTDPNRSFLGIIPAAITDGNRNVLVNGFWGKSRHINYLGEVLMATGIALSAGYPAVLWVWLYPLYYVILLTGRQFDDDKICKAKYGQLWDEYTKRVKYRIIPFIF